MEDLPRIDEHAVDTLAPPEVVWAILPRGLEAALGHRRARRLARLLGCRERGAAEPFRAEPGATLPGFRVGFAEPPHALGLEGRHRFSRYALTFRIEPRGDGSTVRAETRAAFPGLRGRLYRALVVGSGGHVIVTRRILESLARRAERARAGMEEGA